VPKLFILRHGESSPGSPDFERPLREQGRLDIKRLGIELAEQEPELATDKITLLSSASRRTVETTQLLLSGLHNLNISANYIEEGYLAGPGTWLRHIEKLPSEISTCIVVGHNPGISELITILSGSQITMRPGACVKMELLINDWSEVFEGTGNVLNTYRP
jgi:phosphohistidine phosphatase